MIGTPTTGRVRGCSISGCPRMHRARGYCDTHYKARIRQGGFDPITLPERFWSKVDRSGACWIWKGSTGGKGYGHFYVDGRKIASHRVAYTIAVGEIPEGMDIDHLCRNRRCVNPAHLEPVTHRENLLRGTGFPAENSAKSHCPAGHPYAGENLAVERDGSRKCRTCRRQYDRRRRPRKGEAQ